MAEPQLITAQLQALRVRLPPELFDEVADGLRETYLAKLRLHPDPTDAASAAVAEFGDVNTVSRAACLSAPWRRLATALLATGPALGLVWAVTLLSREPWVWSLPAPLRVGYGAALLTTIAVLLSGRVETHTFAKGRRRVLLAASALVLLDMVMCVAVVSSAAALSGAVLVAVTVSLLRVASVSAIVIKHLV